MKQEAQEEDELFTAGCFQAGVGPREEVDEAMARGEETSPSTCFLETSCFFNLPLHRSPAFWVFFTLDILYARSHVSISLCSKRKQSTDTAGTVSLYYILHISFLRV